MPALGANLFGFTHHDPFEDTERIITRRHQNFSRVSPTTIRLRILKARYIHAAGHAYVSFTHHDPFEDTERSTK